MNSLLGPDKAGLLNWSLFAVTGVVAYVLLSLFGQLGGGSSNSAVGAFLAAFKPIPFVLLIIGNALWGVAVYFGLQNTKLCDSGCHRSGDYYLISLFTYCV